MASPPTLRHASHLRLDAQGITRLFGETVALWNVSVEAGGGDLVEVLGRNGSGKSTLLRVLAGLLRPDRGQVRWSQKRETLRIAYVGHETQLFDGLTARESLVLAARLGGRDPRSSSATLERHGIAHVAEQPVGVLSAGTRRRLAIARAVVSGAQVLVVDEPFASLDGDAARLVAGALHDHRAEGGLTIISGHAPSTLLQGPTRQVELLGWVAPLLTAPG